MKYTAKIKLTAIAPALKVQYVESVFEVTENTGIQAYDQYKISVLLTDGMSGVFGDRVIAAQAGDVLFFRPDELHYAKVSRAGEHRYFDIYIPSDYFKAFALSAEEIVEFLEHRDGARSNCLHPRLAERNEILRRVERLASDLKNGQKMQTFAVALSIFEIIGLCAEMYSKGGTAAEAAPDCVNRTLRLIATNYGDKISLEQMASQACCSVTCLSKKFKEYIGCSVYTYLTQYRIAMAERLLKEGHSVTEVCYECGFYDCSHFIKIFKRNRGVTPLEFKKRKES